MTFQVNTRANGPKFWFTYSLLNMPLFEAKATITKGLFYKHGLMLIPGYVFTSIKICEIRLLVHLQTLMMPRLKFENGYVISPHTLLGVYLCIHAGNKTNRY